LGKLDGKVAVITGGASGIGEATVRLFVKEGARVVVADIQDKEGKSLAKELGAKITYLHTDVTQESDVKAVIDYAVQHCGRLDCMFNNAGAGGTMGPIEDIPTDGFDSTVAVLLRGPFLGMKHAAPVMKRQGGGSIINTASIAGVRVVESDHIYSAAKAAVIHLTHSVAMELGESGIRVNCISPGFIATPIFQKSAGITPADFAQRLERVRTVLATFQPIRRAGLPEDIALAALWLASDDSSFVNGHNLIVDGGLSNGRMWTQFQMDMGPLTEALLG
jgi:NAD(P)-dependent dehydrogenase (short-subunit alcohol dehydrogenase family)